MNLAKVTQAGSYTEKIKDARKRGVGVQFLASLIRAHAAHCERTSGWRREKEVGAHRNLEAKADVKVSPRAESCHTRQNSMTPDSRLVLRTSLQSHI